MTLVTEKQPTVGQLFAELEGFHHERRLRIELYGNLADAQVAWDRSVDRSRRIAQAVLRTPQLDDLPVGRFPELTPIAGIVRRLREQGAFGDLTRMFVAAAVNSVMTDREIRQWITAPMDEGTREDRVTALQRATQGLYTAAQASACLTIAAGELRSFPGPNAPTLEPDQLTVERWIQLAEAELAAARANDHLAPRHTIERMRLELGLGIRLMLEGALGDQVDLTILSHEVGAAYPRAMDRLRVAALTYLHNQTAAFLEHGEAWKLLGREIGPARLHLNAQDVPPTMQRTVAEDGWGASPV